MLGPQEAPTGEEKKLEEVEASLGGMVIGALLPYSLTRYACDEL
jgi:hypothetical protein